MTKLPTSFQNRPQALALLRVSRKVQARMPLRLYMFLWLIRVCAAATGPACTYNQTASAAVAGDPRSLAMADLNKDGILDIVTGNLDGSSISVLIGKGDGTFRTAVSYSVGVNPYQVVTGDFNGDGYLDVAAADFGGQEVSVLLGNGDGTFGPTVTYPTGTKPRALVAADFNVDGHVDLAVANSTAMSVSILLGNGNGTFQGKTDVSAGGTPHGIVAADFNGDGKLDLAIANNTPSGTVTILLGNGSGVFINAGSMSVGSSPYGIATTDFNGDGHADLATANFGDSTISVLLGNGNGTFQAAITYQTTGAPVTIRAADVNGDGFADLLATDSGSGILDIFLGNGDGSFVKASSIAGLAGVYDVVVGDFDSDGVPDLVAAASGANAVVTLHGTCMANITGVTNAASGVAGIVPGGWVTLYGTNLAQTTYIAQASDLTANYLPATLKGVSVQIDGHAAFVYFVSRGQVNVVAPDDTNTGAVPVSVTNASGTSAISTTALFAEQPGLFTSGGYALAVRFSDGAILSDTSLTTARAGDILELYATGLGPTSPEASTGLVFSGSYPTQLTPAVMIGALPAVVSYSGLIGAGLYQMNITVPDGVATGTSQVSVSIGGQTGQTALLRTQGN